MKQWIEPAYAKLNLTLDILGKRPDGYHDLRMVMISVSLHDQVTLSITDHEGITLATDWGFLPVDRKNIAYAAAEAFAEETGVDLDGLSIKIEKHIPVCAGTAGGSTDGAAVLRGLNQLYGTGLSLEQLAKIGERIGSDVPYCVLGGTMLAEGRGEVLTRLSEMPACHIVMCKPAFSVSTPELYRRSDSVKLRCHPDAAGLMDALERQHLPGIARRMYNVFEDALPPQRATTIREIRETLIEGGALGACMTGSGSTVFGVFQNEDEAKATAEKLRENYPETFVVQPV